MAEAKIYACFYYAENTGRKCIFRKHNKRRVPLDFFELKVAGGGETRLGRKLEVSLLLNNE
jgi:hypothetical protein